MMRPLYKTTLVIWTDDDPGQTEIVDLASQATDGDAYCSLQESHRVQDPLSDEHPPSREFFGLDDDADEPAS